MGKVQAEWLQSNNVVCIAFNRKGRKERLLKTRRRPTMEHRIELGERPIPVFVIKKLSRARRGWGHVGNNT